MGFRIRKSFKVAPGVRMTVSKSGVGYSVGGKGVRLTKESGGGMRGTVGVPGTGVAYSTRSYGGRAGAPRAVAEPPPDAVLPQSVKPGLFAPKPEKELYRAIFVDQDLSQISDIARRYPEWTYVCALFEGLVACQRQEPASAEAPLRRAFDSGGELADHPFVYRYAGASVLTVPIADGVEAVMPLGREALGLILAELYQDTGDLEQAISVVEQLEPTLSAAVSLAELYSEAGAHSDVIDLTNGLANESDSHAFLLVMRARALRENTMLDGAREALKEALRRRSVDIEIKHLAYIERARVCLAQGRRAQARKDLERIYAKDADYPGLAELMREV